MDSTSTKQDAWFQDAAAAQIKG
ncbi:high light inducible protein, partial [Pseudomonas sp. HMWF031]